jgi:hypothetical protein
MVGYFSVIFFFDPFHVNNIPVVDVFGNIMPRFGQNFAHMNKFKNLRKLKTCKVAIVIVDVQKIRESFPWNFVRVVFCLGDMLIEWNIYF